MAPERGAVGAAAEWAIGPETGVEVDPAWLRTPLRTYRIPEPYWLYRDVDGADRP